MEFKRMAFNMLSGAVTGGAKRVAGKLKDMGGLVMFSHTIFSLPFGITAMLWAAGKLPEITDILWILMALVAVRNGANAYNRIADREIDKRNARTAKRHIPSGRISVAEAYILCAFCFTVALLSAFMLNVVCAVLLPVAVGLIIFYSYSKRFTWLCHYILGLCCGGAPVGAWLAVTGGMEFTGIALGGAVCMWVAGFDIIYATQDIAFDRGEQLHSIPARFGFNNALWIARLSHAAAVCILAGLYFIEGRGIFYLAGLIVISIILVIEHYNIIPENKNKMNFASYSANQLVSIAFFIFSMMDFFIK